MSASRVSLQSRISKSANTRCKDGTGTRNALAYLLASITLKRYTNLKAFSSMLTALLSFVTSFPLNCRLRSWWSLRNGWSKQQTLLEFRCLSNLKFYPQWSRMMNKMPPDRKQQTYQQLSLTALTCLFWPMRLLWAKMDLNQQFYCRKPSQRPSKFSTTKRPTKMLAEQQRRREKMLRQLRFSAQPRARSHLLTTSICTYAWPRLEKLPHNWQDSDPFSKLWHVPSFQALLGKWTW